MNQSEKQLQKAILDYIKSVPGCKAVKVVVANERGTPDILACIEGRFLAIEVKAPKGKLSIIQGAQRDEWLDASANYLMTKDLQNVKTMIDTIRTASRQQVKDAQDWVMEEMDRNAK